MARRDYSEDDDYYTQNFIQEGFVSLWIGVSRPDIDSDIDVLQDLCGVGTYSLDDQEGNNVDFEQMSIGSLVEPLSYSDSFLSEAVRAAKSKNIEVARWVLAQFDFKYDPSVVVRSIAADPVFIGYFPYAARS